MHASLIGSKRGFTLVVVALALPTLPGIRNYGRKHISNYNIARKDRQHRYHGQTENSINYVGAETNARAFCPAVRTTLLSCQGTR